MAESTSNYQSIILLILDGWGISPSWGGNAITMNNPDIMNVYWRTYPHTILQAFKKVVGPSGKVGNSEIGHSSIGSGRLVFQDMTRIGQAIVDGSFFQSSVLVEMANHVKKNKSALHIYGLLSDGGVHSHIDHCLAMAKFAAEQGLEHVYFHCVLDGRDAGATSALEFISQLETTLKATGVGTIASLVGRFYAMDRDNHWSRTAVGYRAMVDGVGDRFPNAEVAVSAMYRKGFEDELFPPCIIAPSSSDIVRVKDGDAVFCFNFRADRSRQMAKLFLGEQKLGAFFHPPNNLYYGGLATYRLKTPMHTVFEPVPIPRPLAEVLAEHDMHQFHIAESEKYAHVTYFFNGGREDPFPGEDRVFVSSPDVVSYSQAPEMSAKPLTDELVKRIKSKKYQFLVANYANVDMVGHTGDISAAATAIGVVDSQVKRVIEEAMKQNSLVIITADHGNAEQMIGLHKDQKTETMHTLNPVPFILVARNMEGKASEQTTSVSNLLSDIMTSPYTLADVAPTILELYGIPKPAEMTGESLLSKLV